MYYQSSSEIQADGLHTLYLMNPNYAAGYSDALQPSMLFAAPMPHAPLPQFVGVPLSHDPSRPLARHPWGGVIDQEQSQLPDMSQQTPRGLSLSLSAHHQAAGDRDFQAPPTESANTMQGVMMGSKYLKAAQELLDEVVTVGNSDAKSHRPEKAKAIKNSSKEEESGNRGGGVVLVELTTAQRQEIQMKKSKLNNMLDEVEQRCRQYNEQMQVIVGSFEQAAGIGSAKSYTQLALKTILKQFRCLKSTISAQIKGLSKSLGEDNKLEGSKFVDTQLRQQRALQQLGMMQNNAWRPQRGLPERAVSVLRSWLFEHFLHPYPKDSDKQMLAKQTGLTRSQVSNWFINARVRLWKPMVEEMYIEETKNNQNQFPSTTDVDGGASVKPEPDNRTTAPPPPPLARTNFAQLISSLNQLPEKSPKKARNCMEMRGDQTAAENYLPANMNSSFGGGDLAAANSFSLSLGLPPTSDHNFLSHRSFELVEGGGMDEASHPSIAYQILDFQNRKPFPPQLLPDFVA